MKREEKNNVFSLIPTNKSIGLIKMEFVHQIVYIEKQKWPLYNVKSFNNMYLYIYLFIYNIENTWKTSSGIMYGFFYKIE